MTWIDIMVSLMEDATKTDIIVSGCPPDVLAGIENRCPPKTKGCADCWFREVNTEKLAEKLVKTLNT